MRSAAKENKPVVVSRPHELKLFPNLQFIYELHMATIEMQHLARGAEICEDFRTFSANGDLDVAEIKRRSAYLGEVDGQPTDYAVLTKKNLTRAFNQYITHWFYPYKGKFHPQLVRGLANIMELKPGDAVLDPFSGSGTTVVEAALLGLRGIGFDISPLCVLIGRIKANAIHDLAAIERSFGDVFLELEAKYDGESWSTDLCKTAADPVQAFDLLARLIAKSDEARRGQDFETRVIQNRQKMLRSVQLMKEGCDEIGIKPVRAQMEVGDARRLPLKDNSVAGVITSPPYSIALNYVENDAHSLEALGYDLGRIKDEFIGVRGSGMKRVALYEEDMQAAYAEMARVTKPGGKISIVLGNVVMQGEELPTVNNCIAHCAQHGLKLTQQIDKLIYGLYNVMQREWVLVFEKQA
jgi:tRNA G10  N-methylase Trm11